MTDRNGVGLQVGDRVVLECVVVDILEDGRCANLQLRAREDGRPVNYFIVFSTQVTKLRAQA